MKRPKTCSVCGKSYQSTGAFQKSCSMACGYEYRKLKQKPIDCLHCGESFRPYPSAWSRGRRYCSRRCYFAKVGLRPAMIEVSCTACGKTFRRTQAAVDRVKASFCSPRCFSDYNSGERHASYRGGEKHRRGPGWIAARRFVRERDKVCRLCAKTPEENGQALSVDHIVPWRLFTDEREANSVLNLAALCRSCHAKKTNRAERGYMVGDMLDHARYLEQLGMTP